MQINELAVLEEGYEFNFTGTPYAFQIVIIRLRDGRHTWRGLGQMVPFGTLVGCARLLFDGDDDRCDKWLLEIDPVAVELPRGIAALDAHDFSRLTWESHVTGWTADDRRNLIAAQFQHLR